MPYLKGIIRLSLVMAFVSLAALITSNFAVQDLSRGNSDVLSDWVTLRVTMAIMVVFIAVTVIALSKVLRHLRKSGH